MINNPSERDPLSAESDSDDFHFIKSEMIDVFVIHPDEGLHD